MTDELMTCRGCGKTAPATEEHFAHRLDRNGVRGLRYACHECWRAYETIRKREYRARKRAKAER